MIFRIVLAALFASMVAAPVRAQLPEKRLTFDVASVKPNKSSDRPSSNFPLGPGDVYVRNGGYFSATNQPLILYILFAYKIMGNQIQYLTPQLPEWVTTDRFDIQARADSDAGKDGMRLMMRSLLADRLKFAVHMESREVPVFALVLAKPEKTGPELKPHSADSPCPTDGTSPSPAVTKGLPALCNGIFPMPPSAPGRIRFAGRNVTIGFMADTLSAGVNLGRPIIDQTGLSGTFDLSIEFTAESAAQTSAAEPQVDGSSLTFQNALRDQLGLKLESRKGPFDVMVVDHIEHPTAN